MPETASFVLLAKSIARPQDSSDRSTAAEVFSQALDNAEAQTGATVDQATVAGGVYDFIVDLTVDVGRYAALNPEIDSSTAHQIALGFAGALAHNAAVTVETVPVTPLGDPIVADVVHSCTTALEGRPGCTGAPLTASDGRTLGLESYVRKQAIGRAPVQVVAPAIAEDWGMLGNKRTGDCTFAAAGHAEQLWAAPGKPKPPITAEAVYGAYVQARDALRAGANGRRSGSSPRSPGITALDALNYWRTTGVAGHRIAAYAAVPRDDPAWVRLAIDRFGCAYAVLGLPDAVVPPHMTFASSPSWDQVPQGTDGRVQPRNSHCVIYIGYDQDMNLTAVTWGGTKLTSWPFHQDYCDEMYVALHDAAHAPSDVNVTKWLRDVAKAEQA